MFTQVDKAQPKQIDVNYFRNTSVHILAVAENGKIYLWDLDLSKLSKTKSKKRDKSDQLKQNNPIIQPTKVIDFKKFDYAKFVNSTSIVGISGSGLSNLTFLVVKIIFSYSYFIVKEYADKDNILPNGEEKIRGNDESNSMQDTQKKDKKKKDTITYQSSQIKVYSIFTMVHINRH